MDEHVAFCIDYIERFGDSEWSRRAFGMKEKIREAAAAEAEAKSAAEAPVEATGDPVVDPAAPREAQ